MEPLKEAIPTKESLYIGDGRLSRIQSELRAKQMTTEFVDGSLICNKSIRIRIEETEGIQIEGPVSMDYYLVRKTIDDLYKMY